MQTLLSQIERDLCKACKHNKAAAQRARINTIKFEKVAKTFRKESVAEGKKKHAKKKAAPKRWVAKKKPAAKKAVRKKAAPKRSTSKRKTTRSRAAR